MKLNHLALALVIGALSACATQLDASVPGAPAPAAFKTASPESVGMSSARLERVNKVAHGYVDRGELPGFATLVAREGKIVHLDAYGLADTSTGRPLTVDDYYYLYSMTKPITSVALLMLYEDGEFQLTDPVSDYLPELADLRLYDGENRDGTLKSVELESQPTIQDVFRHTAGFLYGFNGDTPLDKAYMETGVFNTNLEDFSTKLGLLPLMAEPGTKWIYSVAHDVQARLVEAISGMPFDEFCRTRIFKPLGMTETVFGRPDALKDQFAVIHGVNEDGELAPTGQLDENNFATAVFGGHSVSSTITDYAKFAQMLLNEGEFNGARLLSPKTIELMTTDNLPEGVDYAWPGQGYGLGMRVVLDPAALGNLTSQGVFGWSGAAGTHFIVDPEEELIAVFMTQHMPGNFEATVELETAVMQAIVD